METLETERLILRKFTPADANFIVTLVNTPGWLQFIGDRNIKAEAQAIAYLENGPLASYQLHGFGLSMVELKIDNTPIGMCGLSKKDYLSHPDIGFVFLPNHTGKGYALEMVTATIEFATKQLGIHPVLAVVLPTNTRSIHLLKKAQMKHVKSLTLPHREQELMLFESQ